MDGQRQRLELTQDSSREKMLLSLRPSCSFDLSSCGKRRKKLAGNRVGEEVRRE